MSNTSGNNPWFAATMLLIGLIAGYAGHALTGGASSAGVTDTIAQAPAVPDQPAAPSSYTPPSVDDDPALGEDDAPITLVEFTDYQCPFCGRHFQQTFGQIKTNYVDTGKVKYVVRDFPLSFHPNAQKAAEASECADDQGRFWDMHDKLFSTQDAWVNTDGITAFKQYAQDLGLDTSAFNDCLDSGEHAQETASDMSDGSASGVDGTPGFWVIGPDGQSQFISGAMPYASFQQAFDAML